MILGFDEVGRGSLAGPVTVGLVALPDSYPLLTPHNHSSAWPSELQDISFLRDSKHLTPTKRILIHDYTSSHNVPHATLSASNTLIDSYGIGVCLKHLLLVGYSYFLKSPIPITKVLIDGRVYFPDPVTDSLVASIIKENNVALDTIQFPSSNVAVLNEDKADDRYTAIALASNLAKVSRDTFMATIHHEYPVYNWEVNKGYATREHRAAIWQYPDNEHIRKTFITNIMKQNTII